MKILKDLLQNPETGKYSRKSVNWFVGSILFVGLVIYHLIGGQQVQEAIIWATLVYSGVNGALSVLDKKQTPKRIEYYKEEYDYEKSPFDQWPN